MNRRTKQVRREATICCRPRLEALERRELMAADMLAVVRGTTWLIDTDRDPAVEVDLSYGLPGDTFVSGNWTGNWIREHPGVVRSGAPDGLLHWYLDTDGDPMHEIEIAYGLPGDQPVTGDWDGDGKTNIGVVRSGLPDGLLHWYLDTDGDPGHEIQIIYGLPGDIPVTGDWDRDGKTNVGVVRGGNSDGLLHWYLDIDRDQEHEIDFAFGLPGDRPVTGDWDGNGQTDAGVTRTYPGDPLLHWLLDDDRQPDAEFDFAYGLPGDIPVPGTYLFPEINIDGVASGQSIALHDSDFQGIGSSRTMVVRNDGTGWLAVGDIEVPAGFQLVKRTTSALPPGASDTLIVQVDTALPGERKGILRITNGDGNESPFSISLSATVRAANVEVDGIPNGGALLVCHCLLGSPEPAALVTVRNHGSATAKITDVRIGGNFRLDDASNFELAPKAAKTLVVRMPTHQLGAFVGELSFKTNDPGDLIYRIRLDGTVSEPVAKVEVSYVGPDGIKRSLQDGQRAPIDLGLVAVNDRVPLVINVKSVGNIPLELEQPQAAPGFIVEEGLVTPLAPPRSDTFTVVVDTSVAGLKEGSITFKSNAGDREFSFPVKATVGTPDITLSKSAIDFGDLRYRGTTPELTVNVSNDGDGPLRLNVQKPPRSFSLVHNPSPWTLAPGESTTLRFRANTETAGSFTDHLVITSNDRGEEIRTISLRSYVGPYFAVSNVSIPFFPDHRLSATNRTDLPQTFRLDWWAPSVEFTKKPSTSTVMPGETVTYIYKLKNPSPGDLLRFSTSDPKEPTYVFDYSPGGGIIGRPQPTAAYWRDPRDVDADGFIAASDALAIINHLNAYVPGADPNVLDNSAAPFVDVNGDGSVAPNDVLEVINYLNSLPSVTRAMPAIMAVDAEAEGEPLATHTAADLLHLLATDVAAVRQKLTRKSA